MPFRPSLGYGHRLLRASRLCHLLAAVAEGRRHLECGVNATTVTVVAIRRRKKMAQAWRRVSTSGQLSCTYSTPRLRYSYASVGSA